MTDEERKKLIEELLMHGTGITQQLCEKAADEIERLAALAQSDAEPNRIAELTREIAELEAANAAAPRWGAAVGVRHGRIKQLRRDLNILRKAQSDAEQKVHLEQDAQGTRAMLGGYQMPDELISALTQSNAEPVAVDEDSVDAAFDKFMENQERKQSGNQRLFFHAGVAFGLRHAAQPRPDASGLLQRAKQLRDQAKANRAYGDVKEFYQIADKEDFAAAILEELETIPDTSGLIEAAGLAEEEAKRWTTPVHIVLRKFASDLRSRAADRSMKSAPPRPNHDGSNREAERE